MLSLNVEAAENVVQLRSSILKNESRQLMRLRQIISEVRPEVVSFDVFDTLLWRPFRRPTDLFFLLPAALALQGAPDKIDARSMARLRVEAERRSRRQASSCEVTLPEIAHELARDLTRTEQQSLAAAEISLEAEHLHPHADLLLLLSDLHREGIPYALCSDMYLPSVKIVEMVQAAAGRIGVRLPEPRAVVVSGELGANKAGGLFEILARKTGVSASRIVHVGDNAQADVVCARRSGIEAVHIPRTCPTAEEILDAEDRWIPEDARACRDFGLSASRKQILAELCSEGANLSSPRAYGGFVAGPVFAAFAAWVVAECRSRGIKRVYCAMREGLFLSRLLEGAAEALDYPLETRCIWASRFALRSAELAEATPKNLADFLLTVRGVDVRADLLREIALFDEAIEVEWMDTGMDTAPLADKLTWIKQLLQRHPAVLDSVRRRGQQRSVGLSAHWRKHDLLSESVIHLVDVGWGGSIQEGLRTTLCRDGWKGVVEGMYLGTDHRINRLNSSFCPWSSYLYRAGLPLEAARIVQRTPELIEQTCMSPQGSLREFKPDGTPVFFAHVLPPQQSEDVAGIQDGIMEFGRVWWPRFILSGGPDASPGDSAAFADRLRAIISRSIMEPRSEEVALFSPWKHDSNNGSGDALPILGTEEAAALVRAGRVKHPWQLDWQICYWPTGLFVALGRSWSGRLAGRTRFLIRAGEISARIFGRFDPWPQVLRSWLVLRLRLRSLKRLFSSPR